MPELGSRQKLGARLHFCIRCDFPIAVYGRLSPCEHIFCLDCAKSDALCCICDERVQKIQTIKMLEDVYICAAPYCLKSFLNKTEFESHIHENHSDLLVKIAEKDDYISESASAKNPAISESTLQAPTRSIFSPISGSQVHDREDKAHNALTRDQQQGIMGSFPFPEYPMDMPQPHGFAVPMSSNPGLAPQSGYPPFAPDGPQPFYGAASFEMPRPDLIPARGSEQGSILVFPPGAAGNVNSPENYPRPWNMGQPAAPFESAAVHPPPDGFVNAADSQGRAILFQGEYGRNASVVPSNLPPPPSKDTRDSKGILMPQPMSLPPPPPLPHHMSQLQIGGRRYSGNTSHGGQGYGWQHVKRDDFRSSQR